MAESLLALHFNLDSGGLASVACVEGMVVVRTERDAQITIIEWPARDAEKIVEAIRRLLSQDA